MKGTRWGHGAEQVRHVGSGDSKVLGGRLRVRPLHEMAVIVWLWFNIHPEAKISILPCHKQTECTMA